MSGPNTYLSFLYLLLRVTGACVTTGSGVGGGRSVVVVTDRMTGGGASPHVLQQSRA